MRFLCIAGGLVVALAAGCGDPGPPMGTVSGKLMIGGAAPPEPVMVFFVNSSMGQSAAAQTEGDGTYELHQPIRVGEYTIYFERIVPADVGAVSTDMEQLKIVPKEYRNELSSALKKTVNEGENTIDLDVPKA